VTAPLRTPPGRAGRLWLQHRLAVARKGADLLEHKLRALHTERQRLALREERARAAWEAAGREAGTWLLRGALLGGEPAVRLASAPATAEVDVVWESAMGVRYPASATVRLPSPAPGGPPAGSAALVAARAGYRRALAAAAEQAAVEAAVRIVEEQERATRRRLRAVERRWLPRLEEQLARVQLALDEDEHADGIRLRWSAGRQTTQEAGP
jgi:V/A-type H+-transporting ATPase subunit D